MGEVYRARDTRLGRTVAIKIIRSDLPSDPGLRLRFEREARVVAGLNHPNICALYDIGREENLDFLVMELLEGELLSDRLARGPLPMDQAVRHAIEIAEALAAAHSNGVIHRDLKTGNIMLTRSGAQLLDFGLARLHAEAVPASAGDLSAIPTRTLEEPLTGQGTMPGTIRYMAPEQLEGKATRASPRIPAGSRMPPTSRGCSRSTSSRSPGRGTGGASRARGGWLHGGVETGRSSST